MPFSIQRLGMIAMLLTVVLGLAGCGRKGALDAPPSANIAEADEAIQAGKGISETADGFLARMRTKPPSAA